MSNGKSKRHNHSMSRPSSTPAHSRVSLRIIGALVLFLTIFAIAYASGTILRIKSGLAEESEEFFQSQPASTAANATTTIRVPILIYHSVRPDYFNTTMEQRQYSISPEDFDAQMKYLRDNHFTVISMSELERELKAGTTSPVEKPVVITFDDGWINQYKYAFPILRKYGYTALFYVFTNPIMTGNRHYLSWAQLREMHDAGMEIGSHTLTHPYMSKLTPEELMHEVAASKKIIESHLGVSVKHFASPFGFTSPLLERDIAESGYETGRTTYKGTHHTEGDEAHLTGFLMSSSILSFAHIVDDAQ